MKKHILKSLNLFLLSSLFLSNVSIIYAEDYIKKLKETVDFVGRARKELKDAKDKWVACSRKECTEEKAAEEAVWKKLDSNEKAGLWSSYRGWAAHAYKKVTDAHKSCREIQCGEEDERMKKAARKVARFEIAKRAKKLRIGEVFFAPPMHH